MKGCMATGIFPQMRKDEAAIAAEIMMTAMKEEDGMVIQKDILKQPKEIGKAVAGAGAVREEANVHDMKMRTTVGDAVKDADGIPIPKESTKEGWGAMVVVVIMVTIMITMMIMTIHNGAVVLVAAVVDGLAIRRDIPKHREEDGEADVKTKETMTNMKTIPAMTMNILMSTKTKTMTKT